MIVIHQQTKLIKMTALSGIILLWGKQQSGQLHVMVAAGKCYQKQIKTNKQNRSGNPE